jgi:tetratricopeptide (TPR) repeat protein
MNLRGVGLFLLLAGSAAAQSASSSTIRHVRVRVVLPTNDCSNPVQVRLTGLNGFNAEASTNDHCEVSFESIPPGNYQVSVSGQNFATSESTFTLSNASADLEMKVLRMSNPEHVYGTTAPVVSAAELAIPSKAQQKLAKAQSFSDRHDYNKAIQTLNEAIAIYPAYAAAYNNLGVAYGRLGARDKEREALERAISINDHCAQAHANLARMDLAASDFAGAEAEFSKAALYDPTDAVTISLLTYAEFMNHQFDQAIATSRRAHALPAPHAYVHQVAAQIYEQMNDGVDAIAELEQFLKEDPSGERADMVRRELTRVQSSVQANAQGNAQPTAGRIQ